MSLELRQIQHRFPTGLDDILRGVDLYVANAESVAVMAPSGTGKTTLLAIAGGLIRPASGSVEYDGIAPDRAVRHSVGWVLQTVNLLPMHTALHNVALPLLAGGLPSREANHRAVAQLDVLHLGHLAERPARLLSGGEAQRIAVARALVSRPSILLADEPTANLDPHTALEVAATLLASESGSSILIATHDPKVAALADRTLLLSEGVLVGGGDVASG